MHFWILHAREVSVVRSGWTILSTVCPITYVLWSGVTVDTATSPQCSEADKLTRRLKFYTETCLTFPESAKFDSIVVYSDDSYHNMQSGGSQKDTVFLVDSQSKIRHCLQKALPLEFQKNP